MNQKYAGLYHLLLEDLRRMEALELPEDEIVTESYWIADNYWKKLKELLAPLQFAIVAEEIEFFREVKPLFTCQIEYAAIRSESLLSLGASIYSPQLFWETEALRFNRYRSRFEHFVQYYESGSRERDQEFFLHEESEMGYRPLPPVYDNDPAFCSSHDYILRGYLANQLFLGYCQQKLVAG